MLTANRKRYRIKPRPFCDVHAVEMRPRSTLSDMRYWYCPVDGCICSKKECRRAAESDFPPAPTRRA